jgi:hypothetical protein
VRKLIGSVMVGGLVTAGFMLAGVGAASANSTCAVGGPAGAYSDSSGNSGLQICLSAGPVSGTVTIAGNPNAGNPAGSTGYIIADGAPTNPGALAGYIGVSSGDDAGVVGCSSGDYNTAESAESSDTAGSTDENNVIIGIPPAVAPPNTGGPCAVAPVP